MGPHLNYAGSWICIDSSGCFSGTYAPYKTITICPPIKGTTVMTPHSTG